MKTIVVSSSIKVEEVIIVNSFYYCFLPFIISTINSLYIGFSNHQIIIFIHFLSLMILLFIGLIIFRHLSLSFFLSLIYSVAIIITFIFVIMILDQSEILLRENYNFVPLGLLIILGVTWQLAYSICHDSVLSGRCREIYRLSSFDETYLRNSSLNTKYDNFDSSNMTSFVIMKLGSDIPYYSQCRFVSIHTFTSSAMGKTTKVNKDMSLANNLILENDLSVLSVRLYTDINGILFILGLTLFISLVNSFLVLSVVVI